MPGVSDDAADGPRERYCIHAYLRDSLTTWWHQGDLVVRGIEVGRGLVLAQRNPRDGHLRWGAWAPNKREFKAHETTEACPFRDGADERGPRCCPLAERGGRTYHRDGGADTLTPDR